MSAAMEQRPEQQRPRSKSTFSFKSDKSHHSNGKPHHEKHHHNNRESAEEKRKSHFTPHTKADPNAAMNESQPIAAALEKPTLQSLRSFQHVDANGSPIAEPDLSNPTRSRWERPLDTIRSFEAAIDGEYKRRSHAMRNDSSEMLNGYASRRSSYYGGNDQNRYSQVSGYYGSRQSAMGRDGWDNGGYGGPMQQRSRYNRMQSDPYRYNNNNNHNDSVYQSQGYQHSRHNLNAGGSNGSQSEPYSNDPSSENSSIDQRGGPVGPPPAARPDLGEQYGFNGFGGGPQPILEEYGNGSNGQGYFPPQVPPHQNYPPPVPSKGGAASVTTAPINLSQTNSNGQAPMANGARPNVLSRKGTSESAGKRQSWFKRRFSKN